MKYSQLDTCAKEHALEQWRDAGQQDLWWEHIYTQAVEVGKLVGIHIEHKDINEPNISFEKLNEHSGCATYVGTLRVAELKNCVDKIEAHIGKLENDPELSMLAALGEEIYDMVVAHEVANRLYVPPNEWHAPECTSTMTIHIDDRNGHHHPTVDEEHLPNEICDKMDEFVRDFADYIYNQLASEDEHLNSEAYLIESIEANEPDFDDDGNLD